MPHKRRPLANRTVNGRNLVAVVAAGCVISAVILGIRATFGVYLDPVVDSLGSDRGSFGLAIATQNLMWGLSQPIAGAIADRFGTARVLAVGALGYAVGTFAMATASSPGVFLLTAGVVLDMATGAASFSLVLAAVGRMAPPDRAPMALGIVTAMASVGQFVLIPLAQWLVASFDWRTAASVGGVLALSVTVASSPFRGAATDHQTPPDARVVRTGGPARRTRPPVPLWDELRRAAHSRSLRLLNVAFFVCGFQLTFIGTHLVSYAGDVGIATNVAATSLAIVGLFNIAGSLIAGYLGGRCSKTRLLSAIYALRTVAMLVFLLAPKSSASVVVFGAAMGMLWLATVPLTGGIVNGLLGTTHSGTMFGLVFVGHQVGAFIGAWMGGELADRTGTYLPMWLISLGLGVLAAALHLLIDERPAPPPPARRRASAALVPTGAAVVVLATAAAAYTPASMPQDRALDPGDRGRVSLVCVVHPMRSSPVPEATARIRVGQRVPEASAAAGFGGSGLFATTRRMTSVDVTF